MEVKGLISGGALSIITWLTGIQVNVRSEELDHITEVDTHQEGGYPEPEHGESHGQVGDERWGFISQVEVFFVVDVVCGHFPDKGIEGSPPPQGVVSLGLILSQMFGVVSGNVPVVSVCGCGSLESVQHLVIA